MKKPLLFACAALLATSAGAANICGDLTGNTYGPFDYRKRAEFNIDVVEKNHFTSEVEAGIKGISGYLGGDLSYTLIVIPNHIRALNTMAKVGLRDKTVQVYGAKFPVECYFDRAIRFTPDDGAVRATYGSYLMALGKLERAAEMFVAAVELSPEDPTINYNAGLVYLKKKDYEKARFHAKKAYALEFPLPGLKNKLIEAGQWDEPAK